MSAVLKSTKGEKLASNTFTQNHQSWNDDFDEDLLKDDDSNFFIGMDEIKARHSMGGSALNNLSQMQKKESSASGALNSLKGGEILKSAFRSMIVKKESEKRK